MPICAGVTTADHHVPSSHTTTHHHIPSHAITCHHLDCGTACSQQNATMHTSSSGACIGYLRHRCDAMRCDADAQVQMRCDVMQAQMPVQAQVQTMRCRCRCRYRYRCDATRCMHLRSIVRSVGLDGSISYTCNIHTCRCHTSGFFFLRVICNWK